MNTNMLVRALAMQAVMVELRRHFHAFPEMSRQEHNTAAYCEDLLLHHGFKVRRAAGTGVIADFGDASGPLIVIRGEMDALSIQTQIATPYASTVPGCSHACGHDAHMAMAIGTSLLLKDGLTARSSSAKPVRFRLILQPSEESTDADGKSGAVHMIEDGAVEGAAAVLALHGMPDIPKGRVAIVDGPAMSASSPFRITVTGVGGHIAQCDSDPLLTASYIRTRINDSLRGRGLSSEAIIGVGLWKPDTYVRNIIPTTVILEGSIRSQDESVQRACEAIVADACEWAVLECGCTYKLGWLGNYRVTYNDPKTAETMRQAAAFLIGPEMVVEDKTRLLAEDFGHYAYVADQRSIPTCFMFLGTGTPGHSTGLHAADYEVPEDTLPIGASILAETAVRLASQMF